MLAFARISAADRDPCDRVWAIVERPSNEVIGHAVLQRLDKGDLIEVGYALGEAWWGKGYATEAARATVDFGFGPARLGLIVGIARPENLASRRVLEKTGLRYVGMRHYYHVDVAYYEFTRAQHEAAS